MSNVRSLQPQSALADRLDKWLERKVTMRFNVLRQRVELFDPDKLVWRELRDVDATELTFSFQTSTGQNVSSFRIHETLRAVAYRQKHDPLKQHLLALPPWDEKPRLDRWLHRFVGADDTPYSRMISRKWLVSAVARAFVPGCKVDGVLILHGKQGIGKSTLLRDLASEEFFSEADFDFSRPQDAGMALRGCWIHEWSELDNMSRATHTRLKAFISETTNRFRPPYGREVVEEPRRCVFAGSSNKDDFLTDTTGNRRFWPVAVGEYRREELLGSRDQLLAEAILAFQDGQQWWLTPEEERVAEGPRAAVSFEHAWTPHILAFAQDRESFHISEVMEALDIALKDAGDTRKQNAIAGILRKLGYKQTGREGNRRLWRLDS